MIVSEWSERAEKFSPFPVLSLLVNIIFVGAIPPVPLATLVGLMQLHEIIFLHVSFRERADFFTFCVENIRLFSIVW